ncbi:MAG: polymer-forming cytoskeletal protein [Nitrosomonas sp.]|nr:polymer-forming cytoskeletal protein [Nitrosomonas sp.]
MFGNKKNKPHNHIDTLIGANTNVKGDIHFRGGLRVDGHVTGDVIAPDNESSTLVLSSEGRIDGAIKVTHVIVNGKVSGPIYAQSYLELQEKSQVFGDVHYGTIEIHLGALVEGKMVHLENNDTQLSEKSVPLISSEPENK